MKKLIPILFVLTLAIGCKDECQDSFCPSGMVCVDGQCKNADGSCPDGYEGDNCDVASNKKFDGDYDVDYTGSGGLSGSNGTTTAYVSDVNGTADKIRIEVALDVTANVIGQSVNLPLNVSVEATVDGDTYSVPETSIQTSVDIQGFPLPIDIIFEVEGEMVSETQLNSTLTMSGTLSGVIEMEGTK